MNFINKFEKPSYFPHFENPIQRSQVSMSTGQDSLCICMKHKYENQGAEIEYRLVETMSNSSMLYCTKSIKTLFLQG